MKNMKSVLALLVAVCLMMCLAVPAFATETTGSTETTAETTVETTVAEETTGAAEDTTAAAEDSTGAAEDTTAANETTGETKNTEAADDHDHDHDHEDTTTTGTAAEESGFKKVVRVILSVVEVIASLALILVVLFQSGKEAGLSSAISGAADTYLSKNGGSLDKMLATATKWVALAWVLITLGLSLI